MLSQANSFGLTGLNGFPVKVEVDISAGLPAYETVGLPDAAVKESRERVRAALKNSGFEFPTARITVSLAPADVRKEGSVYDLPIALAILCADGTTCLAERTVPVSHPNIKFECDVFKVDFYGNIIYNSIKHKY